MTDRTSPPTPLPGEQTGKQNTPADNRGHDTVVVVPCYNEAERLDCEAVLRSVERLPRITLLFVDDGSTDATPQVLEALCRQRPDALRHQRLSANAGKAEAVRRGVLAALQSNPTFVGYWDADLSTPLEAIPLFLAELDREPRLLGVLGSRVRRLGANIERRALRHYAGRIFATLASLVLGMAVYDTQCGAKLFRAEDAVARAFAEPFLSRWIFDVELLVRLRRRLDGEPLSDRLYEVPLPTWQDVAGSKLTLGHGAAAFVDLLRVWWKTR